MDLRPITKEQKETMCKIFKESGMTFQNLLANAVENANDSLRFGADHMEDLTRGDLERVISAYHRKSATT